jgi:hypothetical protein
MHRPSLLLVVASLEALTRKVREVLGEEPG